MSKLGYLGGLLEPGESWSHPAGDTYDSCRSWRTTSGRELFLATWGDRWRASTRGTEMVLIRGYAAASGTPGPLKPEALADLVLDHYHREGDLPVDRLEGSFTLILTDGDAGRILLYRNLVGAGFTYYTREGGRFLFASNLADLVDALPSAPRANRDVVPAFFFFRFMPGRHTLFRGIERLMPGEQVSVGPDGLRRVQRQTLGGLVQGSRIGRDAADHLEETMDRVLADCAAVDAGAANLLSGGVDSSYLQVHWNRARPAGGAPPLSYAASVDHPLTRRELDYAMTAAQALGTRHTFVSADAPYADYLRETIASTGEPPNHVQTAYFGHLAQAMVSAGVTTGVCGEGADSLFGLDSAAIVHVARVARRAVPIPPLRRLGASLARALGRRGLANSLHLADYVDDLEHADHPVNQAAVFADWPSNQACFGADGVHAALAYRRALLDLYQIPDRPMDRLHAVGFLGEAMDSASLWTTLFNREGADLLCPFLDSRLLRLVMNLDPQARYPFREPKGLLKRALARYVGHDLAYRPKLGFAQPIFEWLAPVGQLGPLVDAIGSYEFVDREALARARETPNWFLYSLVCYDVWHKLFIDKTVPRAGGWPRARGPGASGPALAGQPAVKAQSG